MEGAQVMTEEYVPPPPTDHLNQPDYFWVRIYYDMAEIVCWWDPVSGYDKDLVEHIDHPIERVLTPDEIKALRDERDAALELLKLPENVSAQRIHHLQGSMTFLAKHARAFGFNNKKQETNPELIGRALREMNEHMIRLGRGAAAQNDEICQTLGKVLGFPWYVHDPVNFPDATKEDGVCVGDYTADTIACLAADTIVNQQRFIGQLKGVIRVNGLRAGHSHEEIDRMINSLENKE
jgi:hypothetical protein